MCAMTNRTMPSGAGGRPAGAWPCGLAHGQRAEPCMAARHRRGPWLAAVVPGTTPSSGCSDVHHHDRRSRCIHYTAAAATHASISRGASRAHGRRGLGSTRHTQLPPLHAGTGAVPTGDDGGRAFEQLMAMVAAQQAAARGAAALAVGDIHVSGLGFHPPGSEEPLLSGIDMTLQARTLNLIIGRSGSGKTTLLQLLAGLCEQTSGDVFFGGAGAAPASLEERMRDVGLVFQFPERHFLGDTIASELSIAWPPAPSARWELSNRTQKVLAAVGLSHIPLHMPPYALSGGQQRRLALAVQLVRQPRLLLLDEPLAGLDWQSRAEVAVGIGVGCRLAGLDWQSRAEVAVDISTKTSLDCGAAPNV